MTSGPGDPAFDSAQAPLSGVLLLEASAGTGKTHSLMALTQRLILERGLGVEQVLLVTYTNAAAAELRERLRRQLHEAWEKRQALDETAQRRLALALASLDLAAVYTIHGFCQRVLGEHGFESGQPAAAELLGDDTELLEQVAADAWRRRWYGASPLLAAHAAQRWTGPQAVAQWLPRLLEAPPDGAMAAPAAAAPDSSAQEAAYTQAYAAWRATWLAQPMAEIETLLAGAGLKRNSYRQDSVQRWLQALDLQATLEGVSWPLDEDVLQALDRLRPEKLGAGMKKGAGPAPEHAVFRACQQLLGAWAALLAALDASVEAWPTRLLPEARRALAEIKAQRRVAAFHDLLTRVHAALYGPRGDVLAQVLARRWPAALIDEFQDTDGLQYAIFRRLFGREDAFLCLSGDPKQAIYGFRGADIHTYLRARGDASQRRALAVNWRCVPELLAALNALFMRREPPFQIEGIGYQPVHAAPDWAQRPRLLLDGQAPAALGLWRLPQEIGNKDVCLHVCAAATAADIARWLAAAAAGRARVEMRALEGGDIAVLVRDRRQAGVMRAALAACGIASALLADDSVLDTPEALSIERLLHALAAPQDADLLRGLLGDELLGLDAAALLALDADAAAWEAWRDRAAAWGAVWRAHGLHAVLLELLREAAPRLLARGGGERCVSNLLHLTELVDAEGQGHAPGLAARSAWFAAWRRDHGRSEAAQLRLESDALLVRVVTLHKSKGLEYPLVYLPFLWTSRQAKAATGPVLERGPAGVRLLASLDDAACQRLQALEFAEELRLAYVGLTRAKYRCQLVWGKGSGWELAAPGWWLHPSPAADAHAHAKHMNTLDAATLDSDLAAWARASGGVVDIGPLPLPAAGLPTPGLAAGAAPPLAARALPRELPPPRTLASFTSLLRASDWHEARDHDSQESGAPSLTFRAGDGAGGGAQPAPPAPDGAPPEQAPLAAFVHFPRGAAAGVCLHGLLEHADFARLAAGEGEEAARAALLAQGFEARWAPAVAALLRALVQLPLTADGARLATLPPQRQAREWGFQLPVRGLEAQALQDVVQVLDAGAGGEDAPRLHFVPLQGQLQGFVDLLFEHQGRHYLLDYKSNWLGAAAGDYAPPRLAAAMRAEGYTLQYLLYSLALHRHLRRCVAGYDYDRHFGGAVYVFLRGVAAGAPDAGLFRARPDAAVMAALDSRLDGGA